LSDSVLVVEGDERVAEVIRAHLSAADLSATFVRSGPEALALLEQSEFALAVVDIDLPGMDGWVAPDGRWPRGRMPVLAVSARSADVDKARVLELGADDVLGKPISPVELVARVRALLRRTGVPPALSPIAIGDISVDPVRREVRQGGRVVPTTGLEFELLHVFIGEPGRVFSREDLLRLVWGPGRVVDARAVDNLVSRLRQKLEADPDAPKRLVTVWGAGYRFEPPA
jgi:DNA-binding response OmpR family regulator